MTVRRAVVTVWLLMLNLAVGGLLLLAGESVRYHVGATAKGGFGDVLPLACAFLGLGLIIAAWRTSVRIGLAAQIVVPLAVLGAMWATDYQRLAAASSTVRLMALIVGGGGVLASLIILAHDAVRRRRVNA